MIILYDCLYVLFTLVLLVSYTLRRKFHPGFSRRFGRIPRDAHFNRPIWIHAVSVGEAMAVRGLVAQLRRQFPGRQLVISTVTPTGNRVAQGMAANGDWVTYLPLDFSFVIGPVLDRVKPAMFVIAETELWPNLIMALHRRGIPLAVVNGRISPRSFKGYRRAGWLFKPLWGMIARVCVQTQEDAQRLGVLGVPQENIVVSGNMKFDAPVATVVDQQQARAAAGLRPAERFIVAGSTHPGEEAPVLTAYQALRKEIPLVRLMLAPRHPERAQEVAKLVRDAGLGVRLMSEPAAPAVGVNAPVLVLDTVGTLVQYYALADAVFVGGSLVKKGGHNILEPAALGKPVVVGPHMFNFSDIAELFLARNACVQAVDTSALAAALRRVLTDAQWARALGARAHDLVKSQQGATARTAAVLADVARLAAD